MKFFARLALLFYVVIIIFFGVFTILFVMNWIDFRNFVVIMAFIYSDLKIRQIIGVVAVIVLLKNFMFARVISGSQQREKNIAFDNPAGRVSVSLSAMEDLVKRLIAREPEVRDVKANIVASRKGLDVTARLVLRSDVNIPETTSRFQDIVRTKIQDTIGIEEAVTVKIDVIKIVASDLKIRSSKEEEILESGQPHRDNIPFQGYRP
ncbi:MAG: alkaline shock response membrane anchor protein AmaP [Candidatus Omnitrophota bacterium]